MHETPPSAQAVLAFWFEQTAPAQWWARSDDFDRLIRARFDALHGAAQRCELYGWRETPTGRLAEVIVLDQFSRHIHRDQPGAFASDALALALAQTAVAAGTDIELDVVQRAFLYMPYMHSESAMIHAVAAGLFATPGMERNLESELQHQRIIDRFGRYPHRNAILGRVSTAQEIEFLGTPGSSF